MAWEEGVAGGYILMNVFSLISASLMHILNLKAEQVWSIHDLK
jgi:hypothetical protein